MGRKVDMVTKAQIVGFKKRGDMSVRQIGEELKVSRHCIMNTWKLYQETGNVTPRPKSGRPPSTTKRADRLIKRIVRHDPRMSLPDLVVDWGHLQKSSVSKRLLKEKLESFKMQTKCILTKDHRKQRLDWCLEHASWTYNDWARVHFSDESNFTLINRKCKPVVRRFKHEKWHPKFLLPKLQGGGGSIGVFGMMSWHGVDGCRVYQGHMDQWKYMDTLDEILLKAISEAENNNQELIFQQDNAPCHKSFWSCCWFIEKNINPMPWPARSPDLSPIEHIWANIDRELLKNPPKSMVQLEIEIARHWEEYPREKCINLIESMPDRILACIKANGGHFKY